MPDRIASGDPYPGIHVGGKDGKPLIYPMRGKCSALATNDVFASIHVGGQNSKPLQGWSLAECDDGALPEGVPLLGVHVGGHNGKPLIAGFCETCDDDGVITDCQGCERSATCDLSIVRTAYQGAVCESGFEECTHDDSYDGVMTWEEITYEGVETGPGDEPPCDETETQCGDFCYTTCEYTRTGYWSEEIEETLAWCDVCTCTGRYIQRVRYVLFPNCSGDTWTLEKIVTYQEICDVSPEPNPNPVACLIVECLGEHIGTSDPVDCEDLLDLSFDSGNITIQEAVA